MREMSWSRAIFDTRSNMPLNPTAVDAIVNGRGLAARRWADEKTAQPKAAGAWSITVVICEACRLLIQSSPRRDRFRFPPKCGDGLALVRAPSWNGTKRAKRSS